MELEKEILELLEDVKVDVKDFNKSDPGVDADKFIENSEALNGEIERLKDLVEAMVKIKMKQRKLVIYVRSVLEQ